MKSYIKSIAVLTLICAAVAVLLSGANAITAPIIEENEAAAAMEALKVVMPEGADFQPVEIGRYALPETVTEVYRAGGGGYVVTLETVGYATGMVILCGVDQNGVVTGAICLSSSETLGYEADYGAAAVGATAETVDGLDVISGATMTTEAYKNAIKDALETASILSSEEAGASGGAGTALSGAAAALGICGLLKGVA